MKQIMLDEISINPIGYGAMRLPGLRGTVQDAALARRLLQEAVTLGVNVIDTADFYGAGLANRLIAESLKPYKADLIISTKVGVKSGINGKPIPAATPDDIIASIKRNLDTLDVPVLDLVFLRLAGGPLPDSGVPIESSLECLEKIQADGYIKHIGLSSANTKQIEIAESITPVAAVQNACFIGHPDSLDVVQLCENKGIPFFAYFPLGMGVHIQKRAVLEAIADRHKASIYQIALAWLLAISPVIIPIPGTSKLEHLRENIAAVDIRLTPDEINRLSKITTL